MSDEPLVIVERARAVLEAGAVLRAHSVDERSQWLAGATEALLNPNEALAVEARSTLPEATGLSQPMVDWALRTSLTTARADSMLALAQSAHESTRGASLQPISLLAVILAGNVFTASIRGIFVPLLFGVPVLVKASSKETRFPRLLRAALRQVDPELGQGMNLVEFSGGDADREAAMLEASEAVGVFGSDETVAAIAERLGQRIPIIAHGHGVSVAYCGSDAVEDERIGDTIARVALDVCAYDQRGCLSPQAVYVEQTPSRSAIDFATRLAKDGLEPLSRSLPRGPLPDAIGAAQAQWRGVAEVEGTLIRGATYALSVSPREPVRWTPGYRNVTIVPVHSLGEALQAMAGFATHLKCIGADPASLSNVEARLDSNQSMHAYACEIGSMQTPAFDAPADGWPVWHGLFQATPR